jgi:hypothetical protein
MNRKVQNSVYTTYSSSPLTVRISMNQYVPAVSKILVRCFSTLVATFRSSAITIASLESSVHTGADFAVRKING